MPKFAASLSMMFGEVALADRFQAARDAGFEAVELQWPYAVAKEVLADRRAEAGLEVVLINVPCGDQAAGERGLAALDGRKAEFSASLDTALGYARAIGAQKLHLMAGNAPSSDDRALARYKDGLREASDLFGAEGFSIMIEPLNLYSAPGYFLNDYKMACDIIADLGRENIRLQFDVFHRQLLHGDVTNGLKACFPVIGHIQTAAVPHRHEPFTGELDDACIFRAIDALGYAGHVGCEYVPAGDTVAGLGWLHDRRDF